MFCIVIYISNGLYYSNNYLHIFIARHPKKRSNPLDALHREIAILKKVDHPNVVKLIEVKFQLFMNNV